MVKRKFIYFVLMVFVFGRLLYSMVADVLVFSRAYFDRGVELPVLTRKVVTLGLWMRGNLLLTIGLASVMVVVIAWLGEKKFRTNSHFLYMGITVISAVGVLVLYSTLRAPLR